MPPSIRLGLELPPLRVPGAPADPNDTLSVTEVAAAAERAGVGILWVCSGGAGGLDAGPLAGSLAVATQTIGIGIVERPSGGRHPSVLARDVTTLDLLSEGRAAVAVIEDGRAPSDAARVAEAALLLHRLLTEGGVSMGGRFYEVTELTIRPRPTVPDGPPVVAGLVGTAPLGGGSAENTSVVAGAAACVTTGPPAAVAAARARLEGVPGPRPLLLWRGELPEPPEREAVRAASVLDAGAEGIVAVLPPSSASGSRIAAPAVHAALATLSALAERLAR